MYQAQQAPENAVLAPMPARVVQWSVAVGETVAKGAELGILEAMKMQHVLLAQAAGRVQALLAEPGSYVAQDQALLVLAPAQGEAAHAEVRRSGRTPTTSGPICSASRIAMLHARCGAARGHGQAPCPGQPQRAREHCRSLR
jgi:pyruvate/2-oxoglutarate dehydrogenase complex dihydrolipoamide acyltransferase (E2) component